MQGMRFAPMRRLPIAYGWLIKHDFDGAPTARVGRARSSRIRAIRRDTVKVLRGIDPRYTLEAAEKLRDFERPALLAWAVEDRFFKVSYRREARRHDPGATLERIEDSYTFVSEDQPERLAELIRRFARERSARRCLAQQPRSFRFRLTFRPSSEVATASSWSPEDGVGQRHAGSAASRRRPIFLPRR